MTTAFVVIAGTTAAGYSLGNRQSHVAAAPSAAASAKPSPDITPAPSVTAPPSPSPDTAATEPSQEAMESDKVISTPVVAEQEQTGPTLTREDAEGLASDSYYFGHNYGLDVATDSPVGACELASGRYVEGEYGDYELADGAADVLRLNYTYGCIEAAEAIIERGVYADDTTADLPEDRD